ncbi:hypothetical protein KAX14_01210 [Candidatus Bipolaricaulota bacterium]|nr:hypothetical protein [Candidatus Bipolaricaulota bacterium]
MKARRFCVRINREMEENRLLERLRAVADRRKRSVSFLVREGLLEYLERQEKKDLTVD